jgi:hypothetical protein
MKNNVDKKKNILRDSICDFNRLSVEQIEFIKSLEKKDIIEIIMLYDALVGHFLEYLHCINHL